MTTQDNKAIIFLKPLSNSINRKHRQTLIANYCQQNNFTLLRTIEYQGSFDHPTLHKLIDEIMREPVGSVTAIVEDKLLNIPHNVILFSVLGALALTKLIKVDMYHKFNQELKSYELGSSQNDFLSIATFSLNYALKSYED